MVFARTCERAQHYKITFLQAKKIWVFYYARKHKHFLVANKVAPSEIVRSFCSSKSATLRGHEKSGGQLHVQYPYNNNNNNENFIFIIH